MVAEVDGLTMNCEDAGSGEAVVLLHAFPLSSAMWRPQIDVLASRWRVLAPDLRGFGKTAAPPPPYTMEQMAQDVARLLDLAGVGDVRLVGLSMGGYISLAFCRRWPSRVRALVLADTNPGQDPPEAKARRDGLAATARDCGAQAIAEEMLPRLLSPATLQGRPDLVAQVRDMIEATPVNGIVGALLGMRDRSDSTHVLAALPCPVLCMGGAQDAVTPPSVIQAMAAVAPNGRAQIVEDAGHLANLEQPEAFSSALLAFLERTR